LAASNPELVAHLAERQVCLDICPSSNYLLSVVPSLEEHPLKQLIDAGVACTINSDDPLLFGSSLLEEFQICRSQCKLSDRELAECARNSFVHSHAPDAIKKRGIEGVAAWIDVQGEGGSGL
jgi:adenosine deaminase